MTRGDSRAPTGWGNGTTVSISRLPGADSPMARAIGIGELTTGIEVGRPVRLRLDAGHGGRVLTASNVVRIEAVGPDTLRISTRNHRYELRRVAASVTGRAIPDLPAATASAADGVDTTEAGSDATRVVAVASWPSAAPGRFAAGARVQLIHERDGERRELGLAILLADLIPGESASFGVDGRVVGTSAIREVVERGKSTVRIVTGNSAYQLELVADEGDESRG